MAPGPAPSVHRGQPRSPGALILVGFQKGSCGEVLLPTPRRGVVISVFSTWGSEGQAQKLGGGEVISLKTLDFPLS